MQTIKFILLIVIPCHIMNAQEKPVKLSGIPYSLYWEVKPKEFLQGDNRITVVAGSKTDMFRDPNVTYNTDNAPKLLFTPDEDFVLTTAVEHTFAEKWDGGAIVLKADSLNWVKFCFEKDYTGARRIVSVVTRGISDDCNSVALESNKVYYKIAKAGPVITLYYSIDNKAWYLIRHFQFEVKGKLKLGFLAQSPLGSQADVTFSDIRYEHKKIKDPYTGE